MKDELSAHQLSQAAEPVVITFARAGDAEAFAEIVRRCQNRVRNFMRRLCNHPDLAEDLSQQVFLKVWRSLRQLRTPAAFHGWLNRIIVSTWLEEVRRNKLNIAELDESADLEAPRNAPGERVDLDTALAQLPPAMRLCVVMAYNDGMSHAEIADATGLPLGTVKANVSRGAAKLRSLLSITERLIVGVAMQDELDKNLQSLFHERTQNLPEEPFMGNLLKRIQLRRFRKAILQSLLLVVGLACCAALSPLLIKGSIVLSNTLNAIFEHAGAFLATRTGMITAACLAVLLFVLKPKRIFRFG